MTSQTGLFDEVTSYIVPLDDADLVLFPKIDFGRSLGDVFAQLIDETPWSQETIHLYGKTHLQPRLIAWYGDPAAQYR